MTSSGTLIGEKLRGEWKPTGVPNKGDIEIRPYRKKCKSGDVRSIQAREAFETRLGMLKEGYKSKNVLYSPFLISLNI